MSLKLAYNTLEWGPTPDLHAMLLDLKETGWDGWEIRQPLDWLGSAERINDIVEETGLPVAAVCGQNWGFADDGVAIDLNKRRIEFAAAVNADSYVIMAPPRPQDRTPTRDEIASFAGFAEVLAKYGVDQGIDVTFHFHYGQVVQSEEEVKTVVDLAPTLKLCVDLSHAQLVEWGAIRCMREVKDRIAYLHLQDYRRWRFVNIGDGDLFESIPALFDVIDEMGFQRWLGCHGGLQTDQTPKMRAEACRSYLRSIGR